MNIPFLNLKAPYLELKEELDAAYHRVMESGWYILGQEVEAFEKEFAEYCEAKHCVGVGNGLDALHLILRAMGIGPGDEVIVPANTYIATWLAVSQTGATPMPIEPDEKTYNINPALIELALTERTKVILVVHLYGQPADMDPINALAKKYDLKVVVDGAHAHGARYKGSRAACLGDAAGYSFFPSKNLGALGDGGAVVTGDFDLAERVRVLRNYGSRVKYQNEVLGVNSRLDELQAALLRIKLKKLDEWNKRRDNIASLYLQNLNNIPGLILPCISQEDESAWHVFVVRHSQRDQLQNKLKDSGIDTLIHYPCPPHRSVAYAKKREWVGGAYTENLAKTVLSLPIGPHLPEADAMRICDLLSDVCFRLNK
jgi:dTDP-4-amino-4,6-dideoxygalactose transaminase